MAVSDHGRFTFGAIMSNAFEVLDLPPNSSLDAVKDKYRRLSMIHHPDRGGDAETFSRLNKAYKEAVIIAQEPRSCAACKGTGKAKQSFGFNTVTIICRFCSGSGQEN